MIDIPVEDVEVIPVEDVEAIPVEDVEAIPVEDRGIPVADADAPEDPRDEVDMAGTPVEENENEVPGREDE